MFDVKSEEGVVTGHVNGVYMDAAVVGEMAGLEVSLDRMHAFDGHRSTRHARLELTLDMTPDVMRQMAVLLANKCGMATSEREELRDEAIDALHSIVRLRDQGASITDAIDHGREIVDRYLAIGADRETI